MSLVSIFCLCMWSLCGVFSCESVSVTEGDSVTLSVNVTEHQMKKGITWKFMGTGVTIAEIKKDGRIILYDDESDGTFKNRLELNNTGSLTIKSITISDAGLYNMTNTSNNRQLHTFNITVYARLPVPVITTDPSESSKCSVLCSVLDVSHVSLSWYKGSSLLSSISVSELNIRLSLSLECKNLNNSYSCVVNNPITNQTQHLTTDLCHKCSASPISGYIIPLSCAAGSLMIVTALLIFCICRKRRKTHEEDQTGELEITYADPTFYKKQKHKQRSAVEDDVVYASVMRR